MNPLRAATTRRSRGVTLIELLVGLAVSVLLMGLAVPSFAEHMRVARRMDAVAALTRLQILQEQFRGHHGIYAADLGALRVATRSASGFYDVQLQSVQPQSYAAVARARSDGTQAADGACLEITLAVNDGMAELGPQARCWNR